MSDPKIVSSKLKQILEPRFKTLMVETSFYSESCDGEDITMYVVTHDIDLNRLIDFMPNYDKDYEKEINTIYKEVERARHYFNIDREDIISEVTFRGDSEVEKFLEKVEDNIMDILFDLDTLPEFYLKEGETRNFLKQHMKDNNIKNASDLKKAFSFGIILIKERHLSDFYHFYFSVISTKSICDYYDSKEVFKLIRKIFELHIPTYDLDNSLCVL